MSDISRVVMDALRKQLRDLEFDAVLIRGRTEQLRDTIDWLENGERPRGRPRRVTTESEPAAYGEGRANPYPSQGELKQALNIVPQRVEGGMASADAGLPSLDEARGILKIPEDAA
jgi:hypothetical protein